MRQEPTMGARFGPEERQAALARMAEEVFDTDWNLDRAEPAATQADVDYLLEHVNQGLAEPLNHDVESVYVGLRRWPAGRPPPRSSAASTPCSSRRPASSRWPAASTPPTG